MDGSDVVTIIGVMIIAILAFTGLVSIIEIIPNSHYISTGICYVCGVEKKKTCDYKDVKTTKGNKVVNTYVVCDDCIIDFCKKIKKDTPEEGKKDDKAQ